MPRAPNKDRAKKLELSPRTREIKKQIDEGRYELGIGAPAKNDQKPRSD